MAFTGTLAAFEASALAPRADSTLYTADSTIITADAAGDTAIFAGMVETAVAVTGTLAVTEAPDTAALAGTVQRAQGGGFFSLWPAPVEGAGFGMLPRLRGEAHGVVYVAGAGAATVPIVATAAGKVDVTGRPTLRLRCCL
jgi:hypothetical protein